MNIFVLCRNYYLFDENRYNIGGIETYISNLIPLLKSKGKVTIIQQYSKEFEIVLDDVKIVGLYVEGRSEKKKNLELIRCAENLCDNPSNDLLLFADEQIICKHIFKKSIAIQHGISWDIPNEHVNSKYAELYALRRAIQATNIIRRLRYIKTLVAVDYNFLNWYRTQVPFVDLKVKVIPNFVSIPAKIETKNNIQPTIIFARRFQWYRGTRIMAEAVHKLFDEISNISVIFAGEGPDEEYLRQSFGSDTRVRFIRYQSNESLEIHKNIDIAVVPTVGSEGTSLSLLEAMSTGCAVICTNVGGMTNIIINQYNGLIVNPNVDDLFVAILTLIENEQLRKRLSVNAYNTVSQGFSYDLWREKWIAVLNSII